MTAAVTGATGFLGAHVADALLREGEQVRVLIRDPAKLEALAGADVEPVVVDLADGQAVARALEGCDVLYHVAGVVGGLPPDEIRRFNVDVTKVLIAAAADAGVGRVVLTSTAMTIGPAPPGQAADEETPGTPMGFVYIESKRDGEQAALEAGVEHGVEVVVTNPTYSQGSPVNPKLRAGTSTRPITNYLRGRLPLVIDTYNNFAPIRDVAHGHVLAGRHGRPGERYLLAGEDLTWPDAIRRIKRISGVHHPVVVLSQEAGRKAGTGRVMGVPLPVPAEALRMMSDDWRYSHAKAERELGYSPRPIDEAFEETIEWHRGLADAGAFANGKRTSIDVISGVVRGAVRMRVLPRRLVA